MHNEVLEKIVVEWLETESWEESKSFLLEHKEELFSAEAEEMLRTFLHNARKLEINDYVQDLEQHLDLLVRCKDDKIGIEKAYGIVMTPIPRLLTPESIKRRGFDK